MPEQKLHINGSWVEGEGEYFESLNPATGEKVWEGKSATDDDLRRAASASEEAFKSWARRSISDRIQIINKFTEIVKKEKESIATSISEEMGKPYWEALTEVAAAINKGPISIKAYHDRCKDLSGDLPGGKRLTLFKPHGIIAVFGPFNFPFHLPNGHIIPALIAGNTILFKPSELTPRTGEVLMQIWSEAGLPQGVLNLVQGCQKTGEAIVNENRIKGIFFTGSYKIGSLIHKRLGGHPEKILALEMGGNNPLIVSNISDLDAASLITIQSAFITSGQRCVCARRLIVIDSPISDQFICHLINWTKKIKIGAFTENPEPFMGPMVDQRAADTMMLAQDNLIERGGKILLEMKRDKHIKTMLSPGIIDVTGIQDLPDEEYFGPLLQVIHVKNFEEAICESNRTTYGLSAGILTDSEKEFNEYFDKSNAGIVNWNKQITGASSEAPFGGTGKSGNARPCGYFSADYCAYPVSSIFSNELQKPDKCPPGIK